MKSPLQLNLEYVWMEKFNKDTSMTASPENRRSPCRNHACDGEPPLGAAGDDATWPRRHGGGVGRGLARCQRRAGRAPPGAGSSQRIVEGDIDRVFSLHRSVSLRFNGSARRSKRRVEECRCCCYGVVCRCEAAAPRRSS
ncbi:uncharacterized protein LOC114385333 [Glycine soja]|uniref:uncharacterized protein n=1 Tax=Glycine max TaxID=3847 RepID=UPI0007191DB0|nr:uncharacterized protein LOC106796008 [Glycine max]XP_028201166.1 uncharacterized protein LOC114385333 [Glycine soja]|eukprot:XP_014622622.1 uncharacterized protein LOC106796008 [Glycine max]